MQRVGTAVGYTAEIGSQGVQLAATTASTVFKIVALIITLLPFILVVGVIFTFSITYYHEHANEYLALAEKTYRCDIHPEADLWMENFVRPLLIGVDYALDVWNFWGRVNRAIALKLFSRFVLEIPDMFQFVKEFAMGIGETVLQLAKWLFFHPFTFHLPIFHIYKELVRDVIHILMNIACELCDSICSVFRLISDILDSVELGCALHNIVNGAYYTVLELVKMIVLTVYRLLITLFSGWDPYVPQLRIPGETMRLGVISLARAAGQTVRAIWCRLFSLVKSNVETVCLNQCHSQCAVQCLLNFTANIVQCEEDCFDPCLMSCHDEHEQDEFEDCVDTLYAVDYLINIIASCAHAIVNFVWETLNGLFQILPEGSTMGLGLANFEPTWDSLRDPVQWYKSNGTWELTPYARPTTIYIAELVNATSECAGNETYPQSQITCYDCRYPLMANDSRHLLPLDYVLCKFGSDLDGWIGLPSDFQIFRFIFCRAAGTLIRLFVSFSRFIVGAAQGLFRDNIYGLFLYVSYEPHMNDFYQDVLYACDTIGLVIPSLAGENKWYPMKYVVANILKFFVELFYYLYQILARTINEIVRAIDHVERGIDGYFYLLEFFCTGPNCFDANKAIDWIMLRSPPITDIGFIQYYNATCIQGYIEHTSIPCTGANGTEVLAYRIGDCPLIPNKWDPDTNPTGNLAWFEALCWIINFDEFLSAFGVDFELPDICCTVYQAARVIVNTVKMLAQTLIGFMSIENYLWCNGNIPCAPIGEIICDASKILDCPCTIFEAIGLPDCFCKFFHAFAELIKRAAGFLWTIFHTFVSNDASVSITQVIRSYRMLITSDPGSPLYVLADSMSCMIKIFWPQENGEYQDYCTSGSSYSGPQDHISSMLRMVIVNIFRVISFALGVIAEILDMVVDIIDDHVGSGIRGLLDYIIRGAFIILFGVPNHPDIELRAGILGSLGYFLSCLLGPANCINACNTGDATPCLASMLVCIDEQLADLGSIIADIIMDIYDIFASIFQGDGNGLSDAIVSLMNDIWKLFLHMISAIERIIWGFIRGVFVWLFGSGGGTFIDVMEEIVTFVVEAILGLLCFFGQSDACDISLKRSAESAFSIKAYVQTRMFGKEVNLGKLEKLNSLPTWDFNEMLAAIRRNPSHYSQLFDPGMCHDWVQRIGTDTSLTPGIADEALIRGCFAALLEGIELNQQYGSTIDPAIMYNPVVILKTIQESVLAIGEYSYLQMYGSEYFSQLHQRQSSVFTDALNGQPPAPRNMQAEMKAEAETPACALDHPLDPKNYQDVECILNHHKVEQKLARAIARGYFNLFNHRIFNGTLLWKSLWQADYRGDMKAAQETLRRGEMYVNVAHGTLRAHMPALMRSMESIDGRKLGENIASYIINGVSASKRKIVEYLAATNSLLTTNGPFKPVNGFLDFANRAAHGFLNVIGTGAGKAYRRTADGIHNVTTKFSGLLQANSYSAYKTRVKLRHSMESLHRRLPHIIGEDLVPAHSFVKCNEQAEWCRRIMKQRTLKHETTKETPCTSNTKQKVVDALRSAHLNAMVENPGHSDVNPVPSLNCRIVDDILDATFEVVDEVFVHRPNYTCGQDNEHWLYFVPATNSSTITITKDGIVAWIFDFLFTVKFPYDFDLVQTAVQFVKNFNEETRTDYVGLLYYARSLIPAVPLFSQCNVNSVARGTFGLGLWRAAGIILWFYFVMAIVILLTLIISQSMSASVFMSLAAAIVTFVIAFLYMWMYLAYGWTIQCVTNPTSLMTTLTGVPGLPVIPKCMPHDLLVGLDYIAEHTVLTIPDGLNVDPTKAYLQSCDMSGEFYSCDRFGFHSWASGVRYLIAFYVPTLYNSFNSSGAPYNWIVGDDKFDFSVHGPTEEQQFCYNLLIPETYSFIGIIALGIWILIYVFALVVAFVSAGCACGKAVVSMVSASPEEDDPGVGSQID